MKELTINIHNLSIGYKWNKHKKIIAHSINTTISHGKFICLIGANGAGKSTLLKTLSAFHLPLCGEIAINGENLFFFSKKNLSRTISIALTEKINAYNMSVYELVSLGRIPYTGFFGRLNRNDKIYIKYTLELMRISNLINKTTQTLSDGERQKVMIAKALVQQTPIVLLDEPISFLDFLNKKKILILLKKISKSENKIIFISIHDIDLALKLSDEIWIMRKGKIPIIIYPPKLSKIEIENWGNFFYKKQIFNQ
ncbi:MAG: ABC transporter ATP-binding protein [Bacteroidales bacterium OttesenSCG-928-I14]|jgi:iron complex transport system ATP-binding protein|nr:ABC transporter ATP-binding protein [Bacteroidales bacterium OttesenSCG-928-I14]